MSYIDWACLSFAAISLLAIWYFQRRLSKQNKQLNQGRESLEFALQSIRVGTWDIDLDADTVSCSKEMLDIWGISPEEFKGQRSSLQSKVHPDDVEKMRDALNAAIENGIIYEYEFRIYPRPGVQRWVCSRGRYTYSLRSKRPIRFTGVAFDITERKEKEEAVAAALKARDEFFINAGHELKTPMTCMQLQLQVAQWDLQHNYPKAFTPEKLEAGLKKQQQHLLRITRILDLILDDTRILEGRLYLQYEHFDLCDMASDVLQQVRVVIESSQINVRFSSSGPVLGTWDRFRLEQVFLNLLMNAIRYGKGLPIQVEVSRQGDYAHLSVLDQGIGIKKEDQKRIFNRFERVTDHEVKGIGLGLFISNDIVHSHGGEIQVESEFGVGSKFTVVLPLSVAPLREGRTAEKNIISEQ